MTYVKDNFYYLCFIFLAIVGYILYKRSRWNTPQTLDHCSNADSIGYLDDMFKVSVYTIYYNIIIINNNYIYYVIFNVDNLRNVFNARVVSLYLKINYCHYLLGSDKISISGKNRARKKPKTY